MDFINTSIGVRNPYDPRMTQSKINQGVADYDRQNSVQSLFKQLPGGNGASRGPADWARIMGPLSQSRAQRNSFIGGQMLGDANTNAQAQLAGEQARENESFGLAGLLNQQQQREQQYGMQSQNQLMQMFQSLLGGIG